jgi:CRISPR-associated protein Cas6
MPVIDLSFVVLGPTIPLDHGYALFSAICRFTPELHGNRRIGVHAIRGRYRDPGILALTEHSRLTLRLPSEEIAPYIALAGKELDVGGHLLRVGIPRVGALTPAANLAARMVTFRHALTPSDFEEDIHRELKRLDIAAAPHLVPSTRPQWQGQPLRRVLRVKEKRVIGYALRFTGLTAEESIRLQDVGLGGRRRMGCGVFVPFEESRLR